MAQPSPGVLVSGTAENWKFQNTYIERLMDHSALTSAHPDDTLILAGPARFLQPEPAATAKCFELMLPLGMVQQMQIGQTKPTTPMLAVGSGRSFYVSGKAQGTANIARLFVNGRNLLRALYTNAIQAGVNVENFDDRAAFKDKAKFYANLDSELFLVPFGMAVLFRDKIHDEIGAFYLELCMINSWTISIAAGQNLILENVSMMFDRLRPISTSGLGKASPSYPYNPAQPGTSKLMKAVFNADGVDTNPPLGDDKITNDA